MCRANEVFVLYIGAPAGCIYVRVCVHVGAGQATFTKTLFIYSIYCILLYPTHLCTFTCQPGILGLGGDDLLVVKMSAATGSLTSKHPEQEAVTFSNRS